jgi:deoxyribodipyrimidine photo-lyase
MSKKSISIFWFRRDLRLEDNAGLYYALKGSEPVLPLFIFDRKILDKLPVGDKRVAFIWNEVKNLKVALEDKYQSTLNVEYSSPTEVFKKLVEMYEVKKVFLNRDYEPYGISRDKEILHFLSENNVELKASKDQVIFDRREVVKDDGKPYTVFTPYMKKWKTKLTSFHLKSYPTLKYAHNFIENIDSNLPALKDMGFTPVDEVWPEKGYQQQTVEEYAEKRDIPSLKGTTRLGLHLRFGTISIRKLARETQNISEKYFNELIWRDFYQMILYHFPHTVKDAFRPAYDLIEWENDENLFKKWCEGKTGYPLVDAGMRELNETGFMHNRVRMLVASFLSKHLLIDWRWGEAYFAEKLLDYDQASNVGGWQWAAGSGVDAAPYFRVFNPQLQLEKFDPNHTYVKKWVNEFGTAAYPEPIVEHKMARLRAIERYKQALS